MAYVYLISVSGVVRYVGKGSGRRLHFHEGQARAINAGKVLGRHGSAKLWNKLAAAMARGEAIEAVRLLDGLTDEDAYASEAEIIASYPAGQLWNVSPGGDNHARIVAAYAWALPGFRDEHRERIRKGVTAAYVRSPGMQAGLLVGHGCQPDPVVEARRRTKISNSKKGKPLSEATRLAHDAAWVDPEKRALRQQRMREAARRRWDNPDMKAAGLAAMARGKRKV